MFETRAHESSGAGCLPLVIGGPFALVGGFAVLIGLFGSDGVARLLLVGVGVLLLAGVYALYRFLGRPVPGPRLRLDSAGVVTLLLPRGEVEMGPDRLARVVSGTLEQDFGAGGKARHEALLFVGPDGATIAQARADQFDRDDLARFFTALREVRPDLPIERR